MHIHNHMFKIACAKKNIFYICKLKHRHLKYALIKMHLFIYINYFRQYLLNNNTKSIIIIIVLRLELQFRKKKAYLLTKQS